MCSTAEEVGITGDNNLIIHISVTETQISFALQSIFQECKCFLKLDFTAPCEEESLWP